MGDRYYLRLGDLPGPSTDERHPNELELTELSWSLHSPASPGYGGGGGAGRVQVDSLSARMRAGLASPLLMAACAEGRHFPEGVVSIQRPAEPPVDVLVLTLRDVLVSTYGVVGHPDGEVEDRFSLVFGQIEVHASDGQQEITAGWDVARNVRL